MHEINHIKRFTQRTGKEASLTFCKRPGEKRLYVGGSARGNEEGTMTDDCRSTFGIAQRIGDIHTHPVTQDVIGVVPSESDIYSTLVDSRNAAKRQISCITNSVSNLIECYEPKSPPTMKKVAKYEDALSDSKGYGTTGYYFDNVHKDFRFGFFNARTGKQENPSPREITKAAFGRSLKYHRKVIDPLEVGPFCDYTQRFTKPEDDGVGETCRAMLRKKSIV